MISGEVKLLIGLIREGRLPRAIDNNKIMYDLLTPWTKFGNYWLLLCN
jgi:hypothetical protein